jgi:Cu-Zn family superoxide dismutase
MKSTFVFVKRLLLGVVLTLFTLMVANFQGMAIAQATTAEASLTDPSGASNLSGQVTMAETADGLKIDVAVTGAPPGYHGIHIHAMGSCADNGNAAGGHYNPDEVKHGSLVNEGFEQAHAGDLGNIFIYTNGTGSYSTTIRGLTVNDGRYVVDDHALIIHADRDDFSQPTGNAGARIGCGVLSTGS